jgi:hypothetical protein
VDEENRCKPLMSYSVIDLKTVNGEIGAQTCGGMARQEDEHQYCNEHGTSIPRTRHARRWCCSMSTEVYFLFSVSSIVWYGARKTLE